MPHALLTAIGADRPGLVDEVSEFIFQRGGNIEDSRMVNLRGQFAIMLLIGGTPEVLKQIRADLAELSRTSLLHAELREATDPPPLAVAALPYRLTGTGLDQPGLVHRVAHLLRGLHVNIESLDTRLTPAPYTGAPIFGMELLLSVPNTTSLSTLRQNIAATCDELNVDWNLEPV